ncbi:hypothetical protein PGT21_014610 [Puccinia graminis f. sp. tritici]|uniref:Uncharacterized protein n=1 Tax=Puccinia graminis f. sp. tritici TaxID=56615 RepID=A0A5B0MMT4_PUCGR|nr:hypothetical protein PGT21_014610 [Puccinia graminis f. sp. tritici]
MYLFFLAIPLSIALIGLIYYNRQRQQEFEEPPVEGYYVYPPPLPHQSALHPSHYWMAPGAVDPLGYPNHCQAFAPQPAPYKEPSQHQDSLNRNPHAPERLSSFQDPQIRSPQKIAQPGFSNASNTITSEKMLVRDNSSLQLPTPTLDNKNTILSPIFPEYTREKEASGYINQVPSEQKHDTPPDLSAYQVGLMNRLSDPPSVVEAHIKESFGETVREVKTCDDSSSSNLGRGSAGGADSVDSFPVSMRIVKPVAGTGNAFGRAIVEEMAVPDSPKMDERAPVEQGGLDGRDHQPEEVLPRYTSVDAKVFERYKNRLSLKQDDSYIGRLRDSYHPPETVSPPRKVIRDDNFFIKPSSPAHNPDTNTTKK